MKYLPPIPLKKKYYDQIEKEINRIFDDLIFRPIYEDFDIYSNGGPKPIKPKPEIIRNVVNDALYDAIANGTIWYEDGQFFGSFNARTSKKIRSLGATYNYRSRTYSLNKTFVPTDLRIAQANASIRYEKLQQSVLRTL